MVDDNGRFRDVAQVRCDPAAARVYEHGWQSWSAAGVYPATQTSPRPWRPRRQLLGYRPGRPAPAAGFQGEGLLAVVSDGGCQIFSAPRPHVEVPSIRARVTADGVLVSADGEVAVTAYEVPLPAALAVWADGVAARLRVGRVAPRNSVWCSWYHYRRRLSQDDVLANLDVIDRLALPIEVVQIDDGYQPHMGDWLDLAAGFRSRAEMAARIAATGRRAGIWVAPFLVGSGSRLAAEHPGWLVRDAVAGALWGETMGVLDVTHPDAAEYLDRVLRAVRADGYDYVKADFLFAGALEGGRRGDATALAAYAEGMRLVRDALGPATTLVGCGAPILPSIGLVDVMRVSTDIDLRVDPPRGDLTHPSLRAAASAGRARSWQHARWWVNDPDCLVVKPEMPERAQWASYVSGYGGLVSVGDAFGMLDGWGLAATRAALRTSHDGPLVWDPDAGADQGQAGPPATASGETAAPSRPPSGRGAP